MARLKRLVTAGLPHHLVQRSMADVGQLFDDVDQAALVDALQRASAEHEVAIHAYAVTACELQLLATPTTADSFGRMMQALARTYATWFNRRHGRRGTLWQGRFRVGPIEPTSPDLLLCLRYVEQTPRRALRDGSIGGITSAAHHTGDHRDPLVRTMDATSAYWALGNTPFEREAAYRLLLETLLDADQVDRIARTTERGWALGSEAFISMLATQTKRRTVRRLPGRPHKIYMSPI